jgi:hypothetical protein
MTAAVAPPPVTQAKPTEGLTDALLAALRVAVGAPGDHRLYRSGKLPGLFGARSGPASVAAVTALAEGYVETVRTETLGKWLIEWVRVTPRGVEFVHAHDSPAAVLRELRSVLGQSRDGVPAWMADARQAVSALSATFETQAAAMLARLDALTERVDAALRRADLDATRRPDPATELVPWATAALAYLDRRARAGAEGACPLGELFRALEPAFALTLADFHAGLLRLHAANALRLAATAGLPTDVPSDPEFTLLHGTDLFAFARR